MRLPTPGPEALDVPCVNAGMPVRLCGRWNASCFIALSLLGWKACRDRQSDLTIGRGQLIRPPDQVVDPLPHVHTAVNQCGEKRGQHD